jgi:iron complex transport system ATP-binding protein
MDRVEGEVHFRNQELLSLPPRNRAQILSYLEQTPGMAFDFNVQDVVSMAGYARSGTDTETVEWALEQVGLSDRNRAPVQTLSEGQRQRAFLARALAQRPRLLLLDEPTAGVDLKFSWKLPDILDAARDRFGGMTVLWAMHDLETASRVTDRVMLMHQGELVEGPARSREVITESNLKNVYDVDATVRTDPERGGVRITPASSRNQLQQRHVSMS